MTFAFLFVLSMLARWVDLRVLWEGPPRALAATWGLLAAGTLVRSGPSAARVRNRASATRPPHAVSE
jgi:hypothetical protein